MVLKPWFEAQALKSWALGTKSGSILISLGYVGMLSILVSPHFALYSMNVINILLEIM